MWWRKSPWRSARLCQGDRGAANEAPTETEIARMSAIVEEGLKAGASVFDISNGSAQVVDGELVPGTTATEEELLGIGRALKRAGHGVFEIASDLLPEWNEFDWMGDLSRETGAPVTLPRGGSQQATPLQDSCRRCGIRMRAAPTSWRKFPCVALA